VPEWGWVALGFSVAYGGLAAYVVVLRHRLKAARRRLADALEGPEAPVRPAGPGRLR
jgi:hypothetical protein